MKNEERKPIRFQCLKCGYCCSHLINETPLGKLGIFILPEEKHWFPLETISPMYGIGKKGKSRPRPKKIIVYQINRMTCPWLDVTNRECMIYRQRPLVCKGYPIRQNSVHGECRFIVANSPDPSDIRLHTASIKEEIIADKKIQKCLSQSNAYLWVFPLNEKRWKRVKTSFP